ncbi:MAG: hypothetical protein GF334_10315 [Candidatus Altiarchaeales archaeon]|nr:hypothetical protein [Candidatus Altiarchaeales archaeon]
MPIYLISFWEDREANELRNDEGEFPKNIHEAVKVATTRWPDRSMEVWSPGRIDYFTRSLEAPPG